MAEIIAFPVATAADMDTPTFYVMEGEDELVLCNSLANARNICRILALDWINCVFTVQDDNGVVLFTSEQNDPKNTVH